MNRRSAWMVAAVLYAGAVIAAALMGTPPLAIATAAAAPIVVVAVLSAYESRANRLRCENLQREVAALDARAAAMRDELARAQAQLHALDEPVLIVGSNGRIAACNPAAEALLDLRADRLIGRPADEAFTQSELLALYERARAGSRAREKIRIARAEGARVWDVSANPLASVGGGVLLCLRDATDAALALRVRADFVANASHELRTPIAAMRIALDTLGALEPGDEAMRTRLDSVIASNVARLEEMARDLLDLSRLESDEGGADSAPLSMSDLARELRATFEPACAARGLSLAFDIAPEVEHLRSDRHLLTLILGNLIDNAAKFAFEGTEIRVVARIVPPDSAAATDAGASLHPGIRFEVIDRGVGIPLDQQPRIFERYYQVDAARSPGRPRRGTGLGLAIVKHAVRSLGGTIRVQSVWQQGTTMIVELPDCVDN